MFSPKFELRFAAVSLVLSLSFSGNLCIHAQAAARSTAPTANELRAGKAFDMAKKQGAPELYAFLKPMPKGADLHMHLSGAVYAETFIAEAARQGLCVLAVIGGSPATPVANGALRLVPSVAGKEHECPAYSVPASEAMRSEPLYNALIDSFSMRGYTPTPGITGHDQFFSTFSRFDVMTGTWGEWLDEVATRAAAQNEQYLEVMSTPPAKNAYTAAAKLGWPANISDANYKSELAKLRDALLASGLKDDITLDSQVFKAALRDRNVREGCGGSSPQAAQSPACSVSVKFLYQVLRGFPPEHVYAQTLLAFEVASVDADVVGLNFVMPEDGRVSMQDYHLQMLMLDYLHSAYPRVHISLHAGELAPGMVPPAGLSFHIREAVELGHAERIGHGVDVLYEDHAAALLKEMAQRHVMVEVNLTSNEVILGVKGADSPLAAYRAAHVPTALSTDDEGVSRIDLTHEYVNAALEQNLSYADLKRSARTSLEHSFLHGESLWASPDDFTRGRSVCSAPVSTQTSPSQSCAAFLHANERAAMQWQLEQRFAAFESAAH